MEGKLSNLHSLNQFESRSFYPREGFKPRPFATPSVHPVGGFLGWLYGFMSLLLLRRVWVSPIDDSRKSVTRLGKEISGQRNAVILVLRLTPKCRVSCQSLKVKPLILFLLLGEGSPKMPKLQ